MASQYQVEEPEALTLAVKPLVVTVDNLFCVWVPPALRSESCTPKQLFGKALVNVTDGLCDPTKVALPHF